MRDGTVMAQGTTMPTLPLPLQVLGESNVNRWRLPGQTAK